MALTLTRQDVARLADLARIELTDDELDVLAPQLDLIVDSVASVAQAVPPDTPPSSHAIRLSNVARGDEVRPSWPADAMLAGAPRVEDGRFRVPRILDEDVS
jgi:aspartyl-tRNA(Asn)/glutamyl-tRNA(Gln) amidotransferase subunit C